LIEPSGGQIFLNGEDIFALPPEQMRRRMGYVIQNIGLFPHYTIEENIAVVPKLLGWAKEKIKERSAYLLERLKLPAGQFFFPISSSTQRWSTTESRNCPGAGCRSARHSNG
jgi:osmoprotectant transport system ATP-binding protein